MSGDTAFDPKPMPADGLADLLLGFARCLGAEQGHAVYVSAPITTGRDFADWYPRQTDQGTAAYRARLRREIIGPNLERARPLVAECRRRWPGRPVVDPTALEDVNGWEQHDYHRFWTRLVEQYAGIVVFSDGWQLSSGCALEFAAAYRAGAEVLDDRFQPLSREDGVALLEEAVEILTRVGTDPTTLRGALTELAEDMARAGMTP
jgi:hypothetical protein